MRYGVLDLDSRSSFILFCQEKRARSSGRGAEWRASILDLLSGGANVLPTAHGAGADGIAFDQAVV